MVSHVIQPEVGVVGAKLLYPNGTIQHAGVVLGFAGVADHVGKLQPADTAGYFGRISLDCEYSAVTAACLAIRTSLWNEIGGLDESFQVAWNDIDLCLRVRSAGYRVVYAADALLYHHESITRGNDFDPVRFGRYSREVQRMRARWFGTMMADPFYNPNLSVTTGLYEIAFPPRVSLAYHGLE
jgi:GT2 family glycosyltransferase